MSLVTAQNLAKSYGAIDVFQGISFAIPHQSRIALVGPNGIGKTTLLRIIIGAERTDDGSLHIARHLKIGYLPQEASFSETRKADLRRTLWEACIRAFEDLRSLERQLRDLEQEMMDPQKAQSLLPRYGALQERYEHQGGYTYHARISKVLNGLGFAAEDYDRPLNQFSGGEQTRALLACLLLEDPQLLVLDEPTNHLDIQAIEWLEGWLKDWIGAAVLVSHDRYFLDSTTHSIWELSSGNLEVYRGNYSAYLHQREERQRYQLFQHRAQQEFIEKEEGYIRRNIAGQNTKQAKGRRKRLERLMQDHFIERPSRSQMVKIRFGEARRSGDRVLVTRNLEIGFPGAEASLFRVPDLVLERGEHIAVMGPNGAGKTTLLRTLLGEVPPYHGEARLGASLKIGYFAQAHEGLQPEKMVLEEIRASDQEMTPAEARNFLALFLFQGDDVYKRIQALSGGERGRVALAKLLLEDANLLFLDEPTNHLDIPSQEVLQSALAQFEGTILLITHDRYLVNALATQVWMIYPDEQQMEIYLGGYHQYLEAKQQRQQEAEMAKPSRTRKAARTAPKERGTQNRIEIEKVEAHVAELERELQRIARELTKAGKDVDRVRELGLQYAELETNLNEQMAVWERIADRQKPA